MGSTPVPYIDSTGLHLPDFQTIQNYFQDAYRAIYGSDVYLGNDSQDGQFLGIFSAALNDFNAIVEQVYNSFSPSTAQTASLSSVVKINGIKRKVPSRSTVDLLIVGQAGTLVENGVVSGNDNVFWNLPSLVEIPYSGEVLVTGVCSILGEIPALAGSLTLMVNTQPGWQSVINPFDAVPGLPAESDAQLRRRQSLSTEVPSQGLIEGLVGSLWEIPDVRLVAVYENDTDAPDVNGIPGHCVAVVIEGGDVDAIADMIQTRKGGGVGTYGNEIFDRVNAWGIPHKIAFFRPTLVPITWTIIMDTFAHYTKNVEQTIARALSDWTNNLGIGTKVRVRRAGVPINLDGGPGSQTFEPLQWMVARDGMSTTEADVEIAFNEQPVCLPSYVQFLYPDAP